MDNQIKKEEDDSVHPQFYQELKTKLQISEGIDEIKIKRQQEVKEEQGVSHFSGLVSFQSEASWLYRLSIQNKIPFSDVFAWSSNLLSCLNQYPFSDRQSIIRLSFKNFEPKQQYFCWITSIQCSFAVLKIKNREGSLVYFKQFQLINLTKEIYNLVKKMPSTSILLIFDTISPDNSIVQTLSNIVTNGAYIHVDTGSNESVNIKSNSVYRHIKNFMIMCPKKLIKKIGPFQTIIDSFVQTQLNERNNTNINQFGPYLLKCRDWVALISYILEESEVRSRQDARAEVCRKLQMGLYFLSEMIKKYDQNRKSHFPSKGEGKELCSLCNKRKTVVICHACRILTGNETRLCIGSCFSEHHVFLYKMSQNQRTQICNNIVFFDEKIEEIFKVLIGLSEDQDNHQLLAKYIRYINEKTIKSFSDIAQFQLSEKDEE